MQTYCFMNIVLWLLLFCAFLSNQSIKGINKRKPKNEFNKINDNLGHLKSFCLVLQMLCSDVRSILND